MGKLSFIQETLGAFLLPIRTKWNDRKPKVYSFKNARTVGILYDATNKKTHQTIADFAGYLSRSHSGMNVCMLGYLSNKNMEQCLPQTVHTDYFTNDDFNWVGRLQKGNAYNFVKNNFDILIDLSIKTTYPTKYVLLASNASYKVGRYIEDDLRYDLLLDIQENNTTEFLITQVNLYLTAIKPVLEDKK